MPSANRPSGPGKPIAERHDAVAEQEGLDETLANRGNDPAVLEDAERRARQADRDARQSESERGPGGAGRSGS